MKEPRQFENRLHLQIMQIHFTQIKHKFYLNPRNLRETPKENHRYSSQLLIGISSSLIVQNARIYASAKRALVSNGML